MASQMYPGVYWCEELGVMATHVGVFGRVIGRNPEVYCWEPDSKHQRNLLDDWALADCNGVSAAMISLGIGRTWLWRHMCSRGRCRSHV